MAHSSWWKNSRGEWYVIIQVGLFLLIAFGPRSLPGIPPWNLHQTIGLILGGLLIVAGALLSSMGVLRLGPNLTPLPFPKDESVLVETGPYALVRHPIYSGLIIAAFGWAIFAHGWLTLGYAVVLLVFFDVKSRREEQWLREKFSGYQAYQRRVRKLIPWIY